METLRPNEDTGRQRRESRNTARAILWIVGALTSLLLLASSAAAQDETEDDSLPRYWEIHAFLMTAGTTLFFAAYAALWLKYISRIKEFQVPALAAKVSRIWYSIHVYFGAIGVSLLAVGTVLGYIIVDVAHDGNHLRLAHSYIGVLAGTVALIPLALGFAAKWGRQHNRSIRWWHIAVGLSAIVIMLVGLSSGWALE